MGPLWKKVADVGAKVLEFAHHAGRYRSILRLGKEQQRIDAADLTIDVGLFALVLEVLRAPYTFYNIVGTLLSRKVDSQSVIGFYLNARLVTIQISNGFDALLGTGHARLVHLVAYHSNDQAVEERQRSGHDRIVTYGKGIEAPHEYSSSFHSGADDYSKRLGSIILPLYGLRPKCF